MFDILKNKDIDFSFDSLIGISTVLEVKVNASKIN